MITSPDILMKQRVIFRADGNLKIGYGHFIRTLGIAGLIKDEFNCVYATQRPTSYQITEINKVCNQIIKLTSDNKHNEEFLTYLHSGDIVVLDNYYFTSDYQLQIKNIGCKLVYIDDFNDKNYVCDALINNIPGFSIDSFKVKEYTKLYLGTDYALLRKEFFNEELRKVKKVKKSIFISFGGADFFNISSKFLNYLDQFDTSLSINLLIGDAFKYQDDLKQFKNLNVYKNIDADKVSKLMAQSDICIVPASSLINEAASIGSKILTGYFADNQKQPYDFFINNDLAIGLGDFRELDYKKFKEKFKKVMQSDYLIKNQRKVYHFQQANNLKNIFYDLRKD